MLMVFLLLLTRSPRRTTLFPYTTLFRSLARCCAAVSCRKPGGSRESSHGAGSSIAMRSEEHTSELQSLAYLVCRHLLEKKNANVWFIVFDTLTLTDERL